MKVLHVETGRHLYGGALQVDYLLRGLGERGVVNALVCARGAAIAATEEAERIASVRYRGDVDPRLAAAVARHARRERVDVVHVHSRRGADVWAGLGARWAGVPALLTRRVDNPEGRYAARFKYPLYARVAVVSGAVRAALARAGVAQSRLVRVPDAVDTGVYAPTTPGPDLRRAYDWPAGAVLVGVAAQFIERKGHRDLIAALPAVIARCPGVRVLLFGRGPLRAALEHDVRRAGLAEVVRFAGFRRDLPAVLPGLDVLAHPARREGMGVAVLQAMACGVPVVAAAAGGVPELVRHGVNGRLFTPGDPAALAAALTGLVEDPPARRRAGVHGRHIACRDFSIARMARAYARLYADLAR